MQVLFEGLVPRDPGTASPSGAAKRLPGNGLSCMPLKAYFSGLQLGLGVPPTFLIASIYHNSLLAPPPHLLILS